MVAIKIISLSSAIAFISNPPKIDGFTALDHCRSLKLNDNIPNLLAVNILYLSLTKAVKGVDFDLNLMYGNEDGLINQIAAFSLTKSFGKAKVKTAVLEKTPDFPKIDESLTTQDYNKDLNELESLKDLNKKLKADNAALILPTPVRTISYSVSRERISGSIADKIIIFMKRL